MFKMMVAPWRDANPYLGVGTYYRARDAESDAEPDELDQRHPRSAVDPQ